MNLFELQKEKLNDIKNLDEVVLSDLDLQLLMLDTDDRVDNGNYSDKIWFEIFRNIARKNNDNYEISNNLLLDDNELLLMNLCESEEETKKNFLKLYKIIDNSKDVIGIKLDKDDIQSLVNIVTNYKPSEEDNDEYREELQKVFFSKQSNKDNVICCPEQIAYYKGWLSYEKLEERANLLKKNSYGQYLIKLLGQTK